MQGRKAWTGLSTSTEFASLALLRFSFPNQTWCNNQSQKTGLEIEGLWKRLLEKDSPLMIWNPYGGGMMAEHSRICNSFITQEIKVTCSKFSA